MATTVLILRGIDPLDTRVRSIVWDCVPRVGDYIRADGHDFAVWKVLHEIDAGSIDVFVAAA